MVFKDALRLLAGRRCACYIHYVPLFIYVRLCSLTPGTGKHGRARTLVQNESGRIKKRTHTLKTRRETKRPKV